MSSRSPRRSLIGSHRYSVVIKSTETEYTASLSGVLDLYDGKHVVETHKFSTFDQLATTIINYWEKKLGSEVNVHRFSNWLSEYFSDIGISNINFYQMIEAVRNLGTGTSLHSSGIAVREAKVRSNDFDPLDPKPAKASGAHMLGELVKPDQEVIIEKARPDKPPDDTVVKPSELFKTEETVSPEVSLLPPVKVEAKEEKEEPPVNDLLKPSEVLKTRETAYAFVEEKAEDYQKVSGDPVVTKQLEKTEKEEPPINNLLRPSEYLKKREIIEVISKSIFVEPSQIPEEKKTRVAAPKKEIKQHKLVPPSEILLKLEEEEVLKKPSEVVKEQEKEILEVKPIVKIDPKEHKIPVPPSTVKKEVKKDKIAAKTPVKEKEILPFEIEVVDDGTPIEDFEDLEKRTIADLKVTDIMGVGEKIAMLLKDGGFDSLEKILTSTPEELSKIRGIGITSAKKLLYGANAIKKEIEE
ncbi:MAG: hypothetical protein KAU62_16170 [Candidatus Heimdallarchaeota archaeon]|nr:hypothetical protein [Candidatus Heimdallarchaeota archaeon]MCG3257641.1 hypothetical protein [Candidatus Heimdallarchaeota archaeon]MCK4612693.1 hypothetical protein [Candidatus Heimdallarchaeota archaeon]